MKLVGMKIILYWYEIHTAVFAVYRASRQASTKHSPYFLLFHQQMRLPIDSEVLPSSLDQEDDDEDDLDQKIQILLDARQKAFKEVEANIEAAQKSQKETYDRKHQAQVLPEGTEVLLENTYQKQRKGGKMDPLWLGPYTIHRNLGKGLYELKNKEGKLVKKKANINRLKVYRRRNDEVTQSSPNNSPPSSPTKSPSQKRRKTYMERMWKKNLGLTVRDKVALRKGKLCDRHMHAANKLLAAQFPHLQGLQSTLLSQTSFTSIQESGGYISEAVQILHVVERDHWVATSYSGCVVNLYDSIYTGRLTPSLEKQIAEIYRPVVKDGMLPVSMVSFQQQVGDTDCGVYSIAAAYSAALGIEPHLMTFDADEMRGHLEQCFEDEKLTPFPPAKKPAQKCREKHAFIHVYCVCGLPESYDTHMIECEQCQKWFHFKCMKLVTEPDSWVCPQCA